MRGTLFTFSGYIRKGKQRVNPQIGIIVKLYSLHRQQKLPISLNEAWAFFSNPKNLAVITPPWLNLKPVSVVPDQMSPGMIVTYRVRPFLGVGVNWVTEITHVEEPYRFVDEQRFGPYKFWHHQHMFREINGGVLTEDLVHYALPLAPLSNLAHALVVKNQLKRIFDHRELVLKNRFGDFAAPPAIE